MLNKIKNAIKSNKILADKAHNVDNNQNNRLHHDDPRINALIKTVHWQGGAIVFLVILLVISITANILKVDFKLPNQTPLHTPPPLNLSDVDYNSIIYAAGKTVNHGDTVNSREITIIGKIYEGNRVYEKWPELNFLINNANVPITGPNHQYKINLNLKPGPNVIETAVRIDGVLYNRKQKVINYVPQTTVSTSTNATISN